MRLIDADTLERKIMVMTDDELCEDCCYNVVNVISDAPTVGGWVSVKDRLPENGQQVVAISVGWVCDVVKFEERTGRWVGMEGWYPTDRITHWMPLPEPPKEKQG